MTPPELIPRIRFSITLSLEHKEPAPMIRKLASGKYRLYSRKKDKRPAADAISAPSPAAPPRRSTSAPFNFSSGVSGASCPGLTRVSRLNGQCCAAVSTYGRASGLGFNRRKMEDQRRQVAEKEAATRRATDAQVLEDAERLIAAWNERQALRAPMIFSPTIGAAIRAGYWFLWVRWQGPCGDLL
jgi:hypothetical protein